MYTREQIESAVKSNGYNGSKTTVIKDMMLIL